MINQGDRGGGGRVVVVTDRRQARAPLPEVVAAAAAGGARWVLLREKDLPRPDRLVLAERLRAILAPVEGGLIVAGPDPLANPLDPADLAVVHLPNADETGQNDLHNCKIDGVRRVVVGRSCHGEAELDRLTAEDYVTVSPIFPSASKPGYGPPLGLTGLARLCARTDRPVLALGGIETPTHAAGCVSAGAAGVAVMGAVMRAGDPEAVVAGLCRAVDEALAAHDERVST